VGSNVGLPRVAASSVGPPPQNVSGLVAGPPTFVPQNVGGVVAGPPTFVPQNVGGVVAGPPTFVPQNVSGVVAGPPTFVPQNVSGVVAGPPPVGPPPTQTIGLQPVAASSVAPPTVARFTDYSEYSSMGSNMLISPEDRTASIFNKQALFKSANILNKPKNTYSY